ncbi:ComF family protein [Actinomadura namibiensis]|uniref:Putative amidophosphoribosyltransferase n=1 Tax=Actinomadura namibiensis TaxID=182080 RepID=A0A7W3QPM5_ACTNM|nr:phosphoribosyltransferase family protein [Actinomadura namibiensis]MBA8954731.1 putative amidophosphoribosyltransferase [Actinomadura namibiensis]
MTPYDGTTRELITAHKERGRLCLARPLGLSLARALVPALAETGACGACGGGSDGGDGRGGSRGGEVLVVPVPSARRAVRRRGHDPTRRMVAVAVRELRRQGFAVVAAPVLRHRRGVADQAGLTRTERAANVSGALALRRGAQVAGRGVVLADDVVTSGASLAEAARVVRAAGAAAVAAGTVAAAARRRG